MIIKQSFNDEGLKITTVRGVLARVQTKEYCYELLVNRDNNCKSHFKILKTHLRHGDQKVIYCSVISDKYGIRVVGETGLWKTPKELREDIIKIFKITGGVKTWQQ